MNRLKEIFQKHQLPLAYTGVTIGVMIISFAIMFVGMFFVYNIDKKKELEFSASHNA